ncbi:hypothetical protein KSU1_D0509 [Candidatus Jettenia caeni]|uniref:Uncharacterized protein n=1 Tax=Candidatus Jettenia caeni TaxID=247490 RepID=I3IQ23_9BACT|nr:hypothetical protein KSU1_D0509 [Candidatus Jettenia caeni]
MRASQSPEQSKKEVIPLDPPLKKGEMYECWEKRRYGYFLRERGKRINNFCRVDETK